MRILLTAIAAALAMVAVISGGWLGNAGAQTTPSAAINVTLNMPAETGASLRIVNRGMEICAEVPLHKESSEYRMDLSSGPACKLTSGDTLGFWLVHANGGIELLTADDAASVVWSPGAAMSVVLALVPCADPCIPPHVAGPSDLPAAPHADGPSELPVQLPDSGTGPGQAENPSLFFAALAALLTAGTLLVGAPIAPRRH
jgi:hypothetical protein